MSFKGTIGGKVLEHINMPFLGVPVVGDPNYDPDSLFSPSTGLNLTASNYEPLECFRGIKIKGGASGQTAVTIKVAYPNGSYEIETVTVPANETIILEAVYAGIYSSGTTAALIFPLI
jgi:hypothetical protein